LKLTDLLTVDRVAVRTNGQADLDKTGVIKLLASLLASGAHVDDSIVAKVLLEREALQSTGIGEGVAIPHGALSEVSEQVAAVVTVPKGISFDAIDGQEVNILIAVIGPKRASGEHLKTLARISRVLRNVAFRKRLLEASSPKEAYDALVAEEEATNR
jgi:nitrogen PTS system EIIA component